ncbi:hypothetical protein [Stackebrandtia nassauensis]|uniref:Uncharacterized protein n=1 Tax=Stackebrandtia nassauensis (strain DSM 44728 / CIP 108903 / NRRL B-16338 / NBRC 102104 / LLR-40K-21) TaxID=446470 RepID=D3Q761_STANL|nr:hypothetical protein [Stackebrandtia nassauensis]ADD42332.1 hypothetical protein Snas_2655 [Stackebrandtia nassauensis DSM 44728]
MSDELTAALEAMIDAARTHLERVRAAAGRVDDESVWHAYVDLNNAACRYDEILRTRFDEVTPFDVEPLEVSETEPDPRSAVVAEEAVEPDAEPTLIAVRQRRDYLVPSVSALLNAAERAREEVPDPEDDEQPLRGIGDAVLELLHAGDGSLRSLDVPELTPLDGIVAINDIHVGLDVGGTADGAENAAFVLDGDGPIIGRMDERSFHTDDRHVDFAEDRDK